MRASSIFTVTNSDTYNYIPHPLRPSNVSLSSQIDQTKKYERPSKSRLLTFPLKQKRSSFFMEPQNGEFFLHKKPFFHFLLFCIHSQNFLVRSECWRRKIGTLIVVEHFLSFLRAWRSRIGMSHMICHSARKQIILSLPWKTDESINYEVKRVCQLSNAMGVLLVEE